MTAAAALELFVEYDSGIWGFPNRCIYRRRGDVGGDPRGPQHVVARQRGGAATWCGRLLGPLRVSFGLRVRDRKIGPWSFVSSNSKNISRTTFLKYKNSRKQELALCHLVNRLVPENA